MGIAGATGIQDMSGVPVRDRLSQGALGDELASDDSHSSDGRGSMASSDHATASDGGGRSQAGGEDVLPAEVRRFMHMHDHEERAANVTGSLLKERTWLRAMAAVMSGPGQVAQVADAVAAKATATAKTEAEEDAAAGRAQVHDDRGRRLDGRAQPVFADDVPPFRMSDDLIAPSAIGVFPPTAEELARANGQLPDGAATQDAKGDGDSACESTLGEASSARFVPSPQAGGAPGTALAAAVITIRTKRPAARPLSKAAPRKVASRLALRPRPQSARLARRHVAPVGSAGQGATSARSHGQQPITTNPGTDKAKGPGGSQAAAVARKPGSGAPKSRARVQPGHGRRKHRRTRGRGSGVRGVEMEEMVWLVDVTKWSGEYGAFVHDGTRYAEECVRRRRVRARWMGGGG